MEEQKIQFDSEFKMEGLFWLSEDRSKQGLSGVLSYSPQEGIQLKIRGINKNEFHKDRYYEVIHGNLQFGFKVSLFDCYTSHISLIPSSLNAPASFEFCTSFASFKVWTAFFTPSEICIASFEKYLQSRKTSDLKFKKMKLYLNLEQWLSFPPIFDQKFDELDLFESIYGNHQKNNNDENEYKLIYKHPKTLSFKISIDDIEAEISLFSELDIHRESYYDCSFRRHCSFSLICNTEKSYDWFLNISRKLGNFLSLLIDSEIRCIKFLLFTNDKENNHVFVLRERSYFVYGKNFRSSQPIILYESIEKEFKKILESWFKKYDELQETLDWFFLAKNNNKLAVETEFLHLIRAVEAFYRKKESSGHLPEENLKNKNQLSLRERFRKIVSSIDKDLYSCSFSKEKVSLSDLLLKDKDIIDIVSIRNNLVHGESKKISHLEIEKIDCYNTKLSILLSYLILIKIGVSKNLVSEGLIRKEGSSLNKINIFIEKELDTESS